MTILVRIIIVVIAVFSIWQFSDVFLLSIETLANPAEAYWFDLLSALCEGVLGPALAISAVVLSAVNRHLPLAATLAVLALGIYVAPIAAFIISIAIYGF